MRNEESSRNNGMIMKLIDKFDTHDCTEEHLTKKTKIEANRERLGDALRDVKLAKLEKDHLEKDEI